MHAGHFVLVLALMHLFWVHGISVNVCKGMSNLVLINTAGVQSDPEHGLWVLRFAQFLTSCVTLG